MLQIITNECGSFITYYFVNENAKVYEKRKDTSLWNSKIRFDRKGEIKFIYKPIQNEFHVRCNEDIQNIETILKFLADELMFKSYWTIIVNTAHSSYLYREFFYPTKIKGVEHMCIGYITLRR